MFGPPLLLVLVHLVTTERDTLLISTPYSRPLQSQLLKRVSRTPTCAGDLLTNDAWQLHACVFGQRAAAAAHSKVYEPM